MNVSESDIAIVGMAAHLPGAASVSDYWNNLREGICSIRQLSPEELLANGESPARMRARNFVPASVILDNFDHFDAEFFGLSPKEAAIMDPQHRQFLEVAWEAMEDAAHPPEAFPGRIGVFAGCGMGSYFYFNICSNAELVRNTGMFLLRHTGNDKDFLSTRVSHVFDLKGPALSVQTACSTSLVAVHLAAQSILNGECDMALAGGVTIEMPHGRGYLHEKGEILSPDGQCHAFDHRAEGTIFGSGAGCVVLRRLKDALADGDHIWAVLKGSAINNDGAAKAGYLAPSVDGQAQAIAEAQAVAGISAETVGYVECHGTGTYLGDPIEVAALTQAFRETTDQRDYARIGSVKTNIGHLDTAAGVASLIKASLALHHGEIPPSLGYEAPNPSIDFENSPFRVNDRLSVFPRLGAPRRAGVNSLGVGGTNAHAVLEEAPTRAPSAEADFPFMPLVLSARNLKALDAQAARMAAHLRNHPEQPLADIAFTLKEGRRAFERRRVLVAESHEEAAQLLEAGDRYRVFNHTVLPDTPEPVFMFPGGGAQYQGMARDLYETEPVFRDWMDRGLDHLAPRHAFDLRALWLDDPQGHLMKPSVQLPLIMICEYALAQLWMAWGVQPSVLIGHSMGENTAACLGGVMSFEDCIDLVHLRGRLFDSVERGGMLSVPMSESDLRAILPNGLDLASVNAAGLCVVSGPVAGLADFAEALAGKGIETVRVAIDIAAHSRMLDPILGEFGAFLRGIKLSAPQIPIISNRSGKVLTAAEAMDPDYWVQHLRGSVLFAQGIATLRENPAHVFLEVGPGKALSSLVQANGVPANQVLSTLRHPDQKVADDVLFLTTFARLWALGMDLDWQPIWGEGARHRLPLPTYPFQRSRYFIDRVEGLAEAKPSTWPERVEDLSAWGWQSQWRAKPIEAEAELLPEMAAATWLIFMDGLGIGQGLADRLRSAGHQVVTVEAGDRLAMLRPQAYTLAPELGADGYTSLLKHLAEAGQAPDRILHLWGVTGREVFRPGSSFFHRNLEQGFWSLYHLTRALAEEGRGTPIHLTAVTNGAAKVGAEPMPYPERALIRGPLGVAPREVPALSAGSLDIAFTGKPSADLIDRILEEAMEARSGEAALRQSRRYARVDRPLTLAEAAPDLPVNPVVLITGGFGGIGLTLAETLFRQKGARLALLARSPLPPPAEWSEIIGTAPASEAARRIAALQALQAMGAEVLPLAGDVGNPAEMRAIKQQIVAKFGRVDVLIHAAGHIDDAPLLAKTEASVEGVLAPKLLGTRVIEEVFPDGELKLLVLFSSTSTATTPAGQVDYVAANAYLNALAEARVGAKTKVIALNWGIWADAGMAASALAKPKPVPIAGLPMLDEMLGHDYLARWQVSDWWLDGHRTLSGQALLPGTGYIDLLAQAARLQAKGRGIEVSDLLFLRPLEVDHTKDIRLEFAPDGQGFAILSGIEQGGRHGFITHAEGRLAPLSDAPEAIDLAAISARMGGVERGQGLTSPQEAHLRFGPRWRVLQSRAYGQAEGLAELELPQAFHSDLQAGHLVHPALMDLATGWAMGLIPGYQPDRLWVPASYARIRLWAPLPAKVVSWVRLHDATEGSARFDITLATPEGEVLAEIEGFEIRRLEGAFSAAPPSASEIRFEASEEVISPAEERLRHNLSQGIPAVQGAEAFMRAVATGASRLSVTSMPLPALIAQAEETRPQVQSESQGFARPDLDSDYVPPQGEVQEKLVSFWQELLGVSQVGVEDSFFDLGGHSLLAVRLFAMIRRTWGADFPISLLFEAPTIAKIAERITPNGTSEDAPKVATERYTHIVAMHPGPAKGGTPIFVVAGMFGNVLNLRHLALALGADRPFYGLQARGLFGDAAPHDDFVAAARDYLVEVRRIQPHGPYLLGGFSGGGLIAWEMARQLEAAGEVVAQTVLLDTPLPLRPLLTRGDKLRIRLGEMREQGLAFFPNWLRDKRAYREKMAGHTLEANAHQLHNAAIEAAFLAALPKYDLKPRQAPTLLYRPPLDRRWAVGGGQHVSSEREYVFHDNLWTPYAPALEVVETPGNHDSMVLDPNVRVLAAHLRAALTKAEAGK